MDFFDSQETKDLQLLQQFNEQVKWFKSLEPQPKFSEIDIKAIDRKKRTVWIELKQRDETIETLIGRGDVFIEPSKFAAFTKLFGDGGAYDRNEQRLYINFVNDGVIIFNLNELKLPIKLHMNHPHKNYGKNKWEYEDRLGLDVMDAILYIKKDGKYQKAILSIDKNNKKNLVVSIF